MPPKSKKDEKDEKKVKRKVEKKLSRAQMTGDVLNERTKEYYLVEIQDLENRLTRLAMLINILCSFFLYIIIIMNYFYNRHFGFYHD